MSQKQSAAHEQLSSQAIERTDRDADGLVGAVIGPWRVKARVKPANRWVYVCRNTSTAETKGFRGYELVALAREARLNGQLVVMPREPWRDEPT